MLGKFQIVLFDKLSSKQGIMKIDNNKVWRSTELRRLEYLIVSILQLGSSTRGSFSVPFRYNAGHINPLGWFCFTGGLGEDFFEMVGHH